MIKLEHLNKLEMSDWLNVPKTKVCKSCGQEKPLNKFYPVGYSKDGRRSNCITCTKEVSDTIKKTKAEIGKKYKEEFFDF